MRKFNVRFILFLLFSTFLIMIESCKKDETEEQIIERSTVNDVEGNVYQTVKIGDQWWMAENLRTTKYNDGTEINFINDSDTSDTIWANTTFPAYTILNNGQFGFLYNGYVVNGEKNIAPEGWHIPADADWKLLEDYIGMPGSDLNQTGWRGDDEAVLLTSKYSIGWPAGGALFGVDEYGFNALPGGCRIFDGRKNIFNNTAFWWTSSSADVEAWYRYIDSNREQVFRQHTYLQYGMSIRCVKN